MTNNAAAVAHRRREYGLCPFKIGDRVMRKPGASYLFPGVVISTGIMPDDRAWHCEVECIAPFVEGCTHVFPASQLVPLDYDTDRLLREIREAM